MWLEDQKRREGRSVLRLLLPLLLLQLQHTIEKRSLKRGRRRAESRFGRQDMDKTHLSLDGNTLDGIDDDECAISDTQCSRYLSIEVDMSRGIDEVDEEGALGGVFEDDGDASRGDGDALLLFERHGIQRTSDTNVFSAKEASLGQQRVDERGLAMIDVSDDGEVADAIRVAHERLDLE